jgi:lactate dehydrogenase-like 2-hydroxyacid dehydrogenase
MVLKITLLDAKTLGDVPNLDRLGACGELTVYHTTTPEQTRERLRETDIAITNKVVIDKAVMEGTPRLKLICVAATGMNNVDRETAEKRGIPVKNVMDYSTNSVAQVTISALLYLLHQIPYYDHYVKSGEYAKTDIFTHLGRVFWEITGKRVGILGLGNIGRQVAKIAEAMGAEVVYYSSSGRNNDPHYRRLELDEFLETSDVVSIHAPLNENTAHLINYERLRQMKRSALLLNAGRGGIVQEQDLVRALNEKRIAGAWLDVMEQEPLPADSVLLTVQDPDRLVLTPHFSWSSIQARTLLVERVAQNIESFVANMASGGQS